jgi:hypothetical protein
MPEEGFTMCETWTNSFTRFLATTADGYAKNEILKDFATALALFPETEGRLDSSKLQADEYGDYAHLDGVDDVSDTFDEEVETTMEFA